MHVRKLASVLAIALALVRAPFAALQAAEASKPNVIYVMCDELGYHEPGFMGSKTLQTPNIDKMAAGGVVFWNLFAGGSVCASTRCSLLTGKHTGLCSVRPNGVETPLRADEETIASVLKARGYATGLGKLTALAEKAHEPAREGSFALDVLNERDRRSGRSHPAQEKATNPKDEK